MATGVKNKVDVWPASLTLGFDRAGARTVMRSRHEGPLLVQRPFYPDGETCHAVILHPPAGIVGGDSLNIQVNCSAQAGTLITTPGATRFYGSDGREGHQCQRIDLTGGSMEWLPQETIYFDRCVARQQLTVNINHASRFIGWDINCFGRQAGNHPYTTGVATVSMRVLNDGSPLLQERLVVNGGSDLDRLSGLRGATVSATMLAVAPSLDSSHWLSLVRPVLPSADFAATQIDSVLAVRYLGSSVEKARGGFIKAWMALRPLIMQKPAVMPRIWAT